MNFTPSTVVKLLRNVPLDNTYKDTITFSTASTQTSYFTSKAKFTFTDFTYQRVNSSIRVPKNAEDCYDCNYIMFQNANFGAKWFYGFVTAVNYLNQNTTEIVFELDVMQTWYFDYTIKQSFVEREHVNDDSIGAHTVPENLETGDYITTAESNLTVENLGVYLMVTEILEGQVYWNEPAIVGGFPVPCYWVSLGSLSSFNVTVLKMILDEFAAAGKSDAIVAVFTAPWNMVSTQEGIRVQTLSCAPRTLSYTPKNNKLYCYPYTSLSCVALGQGIELHYELFSGSPQLKIRGGFGANMQVSAIPMNYEGQDENIQNTLSIKDFPICAWVSNYFQNWLAQNKASIAVSTISSVGSIVAGGAAAYATGGMAGVGSIVGGVSSIANNLASIYQHSIIPDKMVGNANAADINAVSGKSGFYTFCRTIRPEYAKIIDDYFSMFGYKVNAVKIPNRTGRASWNYVKTIDIVLTGSVPVDDMAKIKRAYNNGITFWHGDYVGDYSRSNEVI